MCNVEILSHTPVLPSFLQSCVLPPALLCLSVGRSLLHKVLFVCVLQDKDLGSVEGWREVGLVDAISQVQRVSVGQGDEIRHCGSRNTGLRMWEVRHNAS